MPTQVRYPLDALAPLGADPKTQPSNCAPNVILPAIYVPWAKNMGPTEDAGINMALRRKNPIPVPAVNIVRSANSAFHRSKVGGRIASTPWPRAFQRYGSA
jgi:hypothetical protein